MPLGTLTTCFQSDSQELALAVTLKKKVMSSSKPAYSISDWKQASPAGCQSRLASTEMLPPAGRFPEEKRRLIDGK